MRKFKIAYISVIAVIVLAIFSVEVFSATYLSLKIKGNIVYKVEDIAARFWAGYSITEPDETGQSTTTTYAPLSVNGHKSGVVETDSNSGDIFYLSGSTDSFSNLTMDIGQHLLKPNSTMTIYLFMKNIGPRDIIPSYDNKSTASEVTITEQDLFFDISVIGSSLDPYKIKQDANSVEEYITSVESNLSSANVYNSGVSSIEMEDVYLKKITIASSSNNGQVDFDLDFGFLADISYFAENILTVYQEINQEDPAWNKYGYNALLKSGATKIESNNLSALATSLRNADALGNADISNLGLSKTSLEDFYEADDYFDAPVYSQIDQVNIDIHTGEPIGKLSDVNYPFEWYGGNVTLPAGTVLASGRQLEEESTFTVDVYTYYPTMYLRRWIKGTKQYISVSDSEFVGSVEIPSWYSATFESTILNPNGDVAHIDEKIIARSYVNPYAPVSQGSTSYFQQNYYNSPATVSGYTTAPTQEVMLNWCTNYTSTWSETSSDLKQNTSNSGNAGLLFPKLAQGENYVAYIHSYLYLIKYANNDSQSMVGYGNTFTYDLYNATGTQVTTDNGKTITVGGNQTYARFESEKGSAVIGCYNTSSTNDDYKKTTCAMTYGYNYTSYTDEVSNNSQSITGLYAIQYLTYNTGSKRVLLDGYVGSDKYTSVFCLGQGNPWGNIWEWVFGNVVNAVTVTNESGTSYKLRINTTFDDYNGSNWYTSSDASTLQTLTTNGYNYTQASYNLATSGGFKSYYGVSTAHDDPKQMLVGIPTENNNDATHLTGLCDNYFCSSADLSVYTTSSFGVLRGGRTHHLSSGGIFLYDLNTRLLGTTFSFRLMLR